MSLQTFIFKILDQLIVFFTITIFLYLIMYFERTDDEVEISENIYKTFDNLCDSTFNKDTMGGIKEMYCGPDDTAFSKFILTFKFLYTSSYNLNLNILNFISDILKNKNGYTMSPSSHKITLIILYLIIFYLIKATTLINSLIAKLVSIKPPKKLKTKKLAFGEYIAKSFKNNILNTIFFIITISILINLIKYIFDIFMGLFQRSKLQHMFFIITIMLLFILLFTGIFNLKVSGATTSGSTQCKNNNKYIILIFFLIIPILSGLRQILTILFRGVYSIFKSPERYSLSLLVSTTFFVVLILFNINLLTNLGNSKKTQIFS